MISCAPAKLILCGEHAVVYGRPAIALPLGDIRACAETASGEPGAGVVIAAPDLGERWSITTNPAHPLSELATALLGQLGAPAPDVTVTLSSAIPIASGMGSGAAVATALVRSLLAALGRSLTAAEISALVYGSERRLHGTPSGIDNTVVAFERPIWFQRNPNPTLPSGGDSPAGLSAPGSAQIEPIAIASPFTLLIADTGVRSATRLPVGAVRERWQSAPARYEALFDAVGALVHAARRVLAAGDATTLGPLLSENHALLREIGVSSPELDALVSAAVRAGALGAKLSGAGWGGVMLALVTTATAEPVAEALRAAGAARVLQTRVEATTP